MYIFVANEVDTSLSDASFGFPINCKGCKEYAKWQQQLISHRYEIGSNVFLMTNNCDECRVVATMAPQAIFPPFLSLSPPPFLPTEIKRRVHHG